MNLAYFLVLVTIKNIQCYNPKRHAQSSTNVKNLKSSNSELVIPARYKVSSKTNYDAAILQNSPADYFPVVDYPESIVDSSKPFYVSTSPFPNDVNSSFKSLAATGSKSKSTIDYSWNRNQSNTSKQKLPSTAQNGGVNEVTITKENESNANDEGINETLHEDVTGDTACHGTQGSDYNMEKLFTNWSSSEQSSEHSDVDYVVGFIIDMDEFMKNLTCLKTIGFTAGNDVTVPKLGSECAKEFAFVYSLMTPSNDSIIEFNENEDPECRLTKTFEESHLNDTLLNEDTKASFVNDMQGEFCNIGEFANETINSCTGN